MNILLIDYFPSKKSQDLNKFYKYTFKLGNPSKSECPTISYIGIHFQQNKDATLLLEN